MIVAIDGPAGSGKSSIARQVAEKIGFEYLNSGNFYRAVTYAVLSSDVDPEDESSVLATAESADLQFRNGNLLLDGNPVEHLLHTDQVDHWVARHSAFPKLRRRVNRLLHAAAGGRNVVVEGRDITTVVFPDAEVRIYLDASVEERARRRYEQGISSLTLEEIRKTLEERDHIDRSKPFGSLKLAEGVAYLDTSLLTIDQVCDTVIDKIHEIEPCT